MTRWDKRHPCSQPVRETGTVLLVAGHGPVRGVCRRGAEAEVGVRCCSRRFAQDLRLIEVRFAPIILHLGGRINGVGRQGACRTSARCGQQQHGAGDWRSSPPPLTFSIGVRLFVSEIMSSTQPRGLIKANLNIRMLALRKATSEIGRPACGLIAGRPAVPSGKIDGRETNRALECLR